MAEDFSIGKLSFLRESLNSQTKGPFFKLLHVLLLMLCDLPSGAMKLNEFLGLIQAPSFD